VVGLVEDGVRRDGAVQLDGRCGPGSLLGYHVDCTGMVQGNRDSLGCGDGRTISHIDINRDRSGANVSWGVAVHNEVYVASSDRCSRVSHPRVTKSIRLGSAVSRVAVCCAAGVAVVRLREECVRCGGAVQLDR